MPSQQPPSWNKAHPLGQGVGVLLAMLVAMALLTVVSALMAGHAAREISRQKDINARLPAMNEVLVELLNAETGQRGYLLTHSRTYLEPYLEALKDLDAKLQALQHSDDEAEGKLQLERLRELSQQKLAELTQTIELHDAGHRDQALALIMAGEGKRRMDELRALLGAEIGRLGTERDKLSVRLSRDASLTMLILLVAVAGLAIFAVLALRQVLASVRRLSLAERQIRDIADSVPALITTFDRERRITFANAHAAATYGMGQHELLGKTVADVRGVEVAAELAQYMDRVMQGERVEFESHSTIGGRLSHFQQSYVPSRGTGGEVSGFYSVSMDISEAKAAEQRLRAILDNLPVLITYLDDQLRLQSVNATFESWIGVAPAEVLGRPLRDVIGPVLFAQREQNLRRALAGEHVQFELSSTALGVTRDLHNIYVPDVQADGRVAGVYVLTSDVTPLKGAQRQLAELARSDALTGLPNRRQFDEALSHALMRSRRDGSAVGLLYLDIDHFKAINDVHGHAAGDTVLKEFGLRLRACVRATDLAARLAGDEFVVLLVGLADPEDASAVAQKILHCMRKAVSVEHRELHVSTSIGLVVHDGGPVTPQELLGRADRALYQAKRSGRDGYARYDENAADA